MTSYTNALSGGLIQPSNMSYAAYPFKEDLILAWPSSFSNNPKVTAGIMDLRAEEEGLTVILPDARAVSVGQNILLNNRGDQDFDVGARNEVGKVDPVIPGIKSGKSFYLYLTDNSKPQGNWNVIPFGAGSVVVTSVGAQSDDEEALKIEGSPVTGAGRFLFKLSNTLRVLSAFTKKGFAVLTPKGWEGRTLQEGQNISVKDGDGEKGDPVIATKEDVAFKTAGIDALTIKSLTGKDVVTGDTVKKESLPLDRLYSTGHSGLIVGYDEDHAYRNLDFNSNGSDLWKVPTQVEKRGLPVLRSLGDLFKAQEDGSLNSAKMSPLSLNQLVLPKTPCLMGGTTTNEGSWYELTLQDWQIPTRRAGNNGPTGVNFSTLWDAQKAGILSGKKLEKNSVSLSTLENPGQIAPFAMGWVGADGTLYKSLNVAKIDHTATGKYYISFQKVASSKAYIVLVTPYYKAEQGIHAEPQVTQATYFSVFCSGNQSPEDFIDNSFFFVVWDW